MTHGEKFVAIAENEEKIFLAGKEEGYAEGYIEGYNAAKEEVNGYTVTIQYIYNCSPVYISKHYPQSEDDYDVVLPKTNTLGDWENQPTDIKSVILENVTELYFWENDEDPLDNVFTNRGLCVLKDGEFLIYNYYSDKCGFNDMVSVPAGDYTDMEIPSLEKNNFAVTEDMTITIDHIYD